MGTGVFDVLSPEVLVVQCNATLTFNYRTSLSGVPITVTASLKLLRDDDTLSNESIASTTVRLVRQVASSEFEYVCLPLMCANGSALLLASIARVQVTVVVPDGTAEVTDVDFREDRTCDAQPSGRKSVALS